MGCGKSTVAKYLEVSTDRELFDTDQLIVEKDGRSIADIFNSDGELFFRQLETQLLINLIDVDNAIISTGGGIVEKQENWPLLKTMGRIYFLDLPWVELQQRISLGKGRPLAGDGINWAQVRQLWERRRPLYCQADEIIEVDQMSVADIAEEILRRENER